MAKPKIEHITLGTFEFISFNGNVDLQGSQLEVLARQGVDGLAYRDVGKRNQPTSFSATVDVDSQAAGQALLRAYKSIQGKVVTFTEGNGTIWLDTTVLAVIRAGNMQAITGAAGGVSSAKQFLLSTQWSLQILDEG